MSDKDPENHPSLPTRFALSVFDNLAPASQEAVHWVRKPRTGPIIHGHIFRSPGFTTRHLLYLRNYFGLSFSGHIPILVRHRIALSVLAGTVSSAMAQIFTFCDPAFRGEQPPTNDRSFWDQKKQGERMWDHNEGEEHANNGLILDGPVRVRISTGRSLSA
ncbi:hypothetical protein OQA88_3300 [Cercophora sp. LCS_1]